MAAVSSKGIGKKDTIRIALVGNPNSGKTTLFNALTGSNQFVGNWPGVTVEKKEGRLKKHENVVITDLPGIYSLSPYTPEEVVARNYLLEEKPDSILNIVDGTNLERNLYLTTQLAELGIPMVVAVNMMDVVRKNGDRISVQRLSRSLGCRVVEISALKGEGLIPASQAAVEAAAAKERVRQDGCFSEAIESALAEIEETALGDVPEEKRRFFAIKLFERDERVLAQAKMDKASLAAVGKAIEAVESKLDDDSESIITNERYAYIEKIAGSCGKRSSGEMTVSDKIDRIVTNRWLGLPVFAVIMFLVYYLSMVTVGSAATDWANDGLFGDGWHLLGIGSSAYESDLEEYTSAALIVDGYEAYIAENGTAPDGEFEYLTEDGETLEVTARTATPAQLSSALEVVEGFGKEPDPADYGIWVKGVPVLVGEALDSLGTAPWLKGLINDGIVAGVGAVLGFVPQMLVLFLLLAFLEACGYMARIAFVLDRVFRRFGLSGKSFIPMLIGTGCGIPGIMASRTIENENDRRMTVMTTTFIPCGAKVPFISMVAGAVFGGSAWVATSAYFVGLAAIILSGIMLKKTRMFSGEPAPFVMELPAYHFPTVGNVLRSMWERGWSFVKKAGTIILVSTVLIWFASYFGFTQDGFRMLSEEELEDSLLASVGGAAAWLFKPLGWGNWRPVVASVTGLVAKENIVGTMGILYPDGWSGISAGFTKLAGYSFLMFNLLCAPCFAAIGAIKREMNSAGWTLFAVGYQCAFAYAVSLAVYQIGSLFAGNPSIIGVIAAAIILAVMLYMLLRPSKRQAMSVKVRGLTDQM